MKQYSYFNVSRLFYSLFDNRLLTTEQFEKFKKICYESYLMLSDDDTEFLDGMSDYLIEKINKPLPTITIDKEGWLIDYKRGGE